MPATFVSYTDYAVAASFFNFWASYDIYTLSLHDALPICWSRRALCCPDQRRAGNVRRGEERVRGGGWPRRGPRRGHPRSEEHTSETPVTPISRMPSSA